MEEVKLRVRRRELGTVRPFCKINQKNGIKSARWFCRSRAGYKKGDDNDIDGKDSNARAENHGKECCCLRCLRENTLGLRERRPL